MCGETSGARCETRGDGAQAGSSVVCYPVPRLSRDLGRRKVSSCLSPMDKGIDGNTVIGINEHRIDLYLAELGSVLNEDRT